MTSAHGLQFAFETEEVANAEEGKYGANVRVGMSGSRAAYEELVRGASSEELLSLAWGALYITLRKAGVSVSDMKRVMRAVEADNARTLHAGR